MHPPIRCIFNNTKMCQKSGKKQQIGQVKNFIHALFSGKRSCTRFFAFSITQKSAINRVKTTNWVSEGFDT